MSGVVPAGLGCPAPPTPRFVSGFCPVGRAGRRCQASDLGGNVGDVHVPQDRQHRDAVPRPTSWSCCARPVVGRERATPSMAPGDRGGRRPSPPPPVNGEPSADSPSQSVLPASVGVRRRAGVCPCQSGTRGRRQAAARRRRGDVQWAGNLRDDVEAAVDEVEIPDVVEHPSERPVRRPRRRAGRPARRRGLGRLVRQERRAKPGLDPAGCR